jgi:hypothetical protein
VLFDNVRLLTRVLFQIEQHETRKLRADQPQLDIVGPARIVPLQFPFADAQAVVSGQAVVLLDQVIAAVTRWRDEYDLAPLFRQPVRDPAVIGYRHDVMRDLDDQALVDAILGFARGMRIVRQHRALADSISHRHEQAIWLLESARTYTTTVRRLTADLRDAAPASQGLRAVLDHLDDHVASAAFTELVDDVAQVTRRLAAVTYRLHVVDLRITVSADDDPVDYGHQVEATFERFRQDDRDDQRREAAPSGKLNDVEAAVLDRVARLHPETFGALEDFRTRHADHLDPAVVTFDREIQFYLAYLDHITPLRRAGLSLCYPEVDVDGGPELVAREAFDIALAGKLAVRGERVVANDVRLTGDERILVVSGANQGGKTTFARTVGQLHHLAGLGCPVPAREARLSLRLQAVELLGDSLAISPQLGPSVLEGALAGDVGGVEPGVEVPPPCRDLDQLGGDEPVLGQPAAALEPVRASAPKLPGMSLGSPFKSRRGRFLPTHPAATRAAS